MDVSNSVDVTNPAAVAAELRCLFQQRYPTVDFYQIEVLMRDFARLYRGDFPGFRACDLKYHDLQHVLDVTLAMARLMEGHDMCHDAGKQLTPEMALTGIASALFHDSGYIRRNHDTRHSNGAAYTRIHVSRGARFLSEYLPTVGLARIVPACQRLVHFTGYEQNPDEIPTASAMERKLGTLLGTADLIAQMADVDYLRKCHDYLYAEFEAGGLAGQDGKRSNEGIVYRSPAHLLEATPNFIHDAIAVRLDGYFKGVYRFAGEYFGGSNLYMDAIADNSARLEELLAQGRRNPVPVIPH